MGKARLVLELPVDRTKYYRLWPDGLVRMYLFDESARTHERSQQRWDSFAGWLWRMLEGGAHDLYAHPMVCLESDAKMQKLLSRPPFRGPSRRLQDWCWIIPCESREALLELMKQSSFERVVLFVAH